MGPVPLLEGDRDRKPETLGQVLTAILVQRDPEILDPKVTFTSP